MHTSIRGLLAASILATSAFVAAPAAAQDIELSGNVALVTDYRFRGVSFTDGDIALQGGIDAALPSGFYVGTWASNISGDPVLGELEVDLYGGWSGEVNGIALDAGLLYYVYPTGDLPGDTDYFEPYASIGTTLGPVGATLGVNYAWDQNAIGGENFYIYTDFEAAVPDTAFSLSAHLGYIDGVQSPDIIGGGTDDTGFDWGIGASYAVTEALSVGVNYVDSEGTSAEDSTDAGFFFTIGYSM